MTPRAREVRGAARQRGAVLLVVLWVTALLALLAAAFSAETSARARGTHAAVDGAAARAIAEGALWFAVFGLAGAVAGDPSLPRDGRMRQLAQPGAELRVAVQDTSGKIDLNRADALLLAALFARFEPDADRLARLVDALEDWRDPDEERRLHGAEADDYAGAGLSWAPGNRPFASVDELGLVLGVDRALLEALRPLVTVHSGQGGVNPLVAPREVLLAMPGAEAAEVESRLATRADLEERSSRLARVAAGTYELVATAKMDSGARRSVRAVVRIRPGQRVPYAVLEWGETAVDLFEPPPPALEERM